MNETPGAARQELGLRLRQLRGRRTGPAVAEALGWSHSKLSRIEAGTVAIRASDLRRLLALYGVTGERVEFYLGLQQQRVLDGAAGSGPPWAVQEMPEPDPVMTQREVLLAILAELQAIRALLDRRDE